MPATERITKKHALQDEKDAWDSYASAALAVLVTPDSARNDVVALAADYATLMLDERRRAFPAKDKGLWSAPLKI